MRAVKKNTETRNEATIIHAANNYHIIITITHADCIRTNSAALKQLVSLPGSTHTNEAKETTQCASHGWFTWANYYRGPTCREGGASLPNSELLGPVSQARVIQQLRVRSLPRLLQLCNVALGCLLLHHRLHLIINNVLSMEEKIYLRYELRYPSGSCGATLVEYILVSSTSPVPSPKPFLCACVCGVSVCTRKKERKKERERERERCE